MPHPSQEGDDEDAAAAPTTATTTAIPDGRQAADCPTGFRLVTQLMGQVKVNDSCYPPCHKSSSSAPHYATTESLPLNQKPPAKDMRMEEGATTSTSPNSKTLREIKETNAVGTGTKGDFPKAGIKVKFLLDEFLKAAATIGDIGDLSTGEVRVQFIIPLTGETKSSYCQMLRDQNHWAYTDEPDAFISHAHQHKFKDLLSALEWKFRGDDDRDASVWLDLFSINQHEPMDWTFDWLSTTFRSNVAGIGRTVMVMSPWDNPHPYSRTWCIFEAFSTIAEGGKFDIALSKVDEEVFLSDIRYEKAGNKMKTMFATIRAENSECSVTSDKISIYKIIRETVGFDKLDTMLFKCYRKWVIDVAVRALDSCVDNEQRIGLYFCLNQLYSEQGNHRHAEDYGRRGLNACKDMLGEDHLNTVAMTNNLAITLSHQGQYDKAIGLYQRCLVVQKVVLGEDHPKTLNTINNLADTLRCKGHYDKSVELLQPCLDMQRVVLGFDHPETLTTMMNLANVLRCQGQYDEAIELYYRCLDMQNIALTEDHPNTLHTMNNLAVALAEQGFFNGEAIELHKKCLSRRKVILGKDHPNTFQSMNGLANVLQKQGRLDEAVRLSRYCFEKQISLLGVDHLNTLNTMDILASSLEKQGKREEAVKIFKTCLEKAEAVIGGNHPFTVKVRDELRKSTERAVLRASSR